MKIIPTTLLLAASVLLMAGCSSTKINSGPISARTFNFVNPGKSLSEFPEDRQHVHTLIQDAITQSLAARGINRVDRGGDITVAYLIIVGNNTATTSINDYFGVGRDSEELLDKAQEKYTDNPNPNYFVAGTLLIDIIDPRTWKVLARNYTTQALLKDLPPGAQATRVRQAVDDILGKFRFEQK